MLDIDEIRGFTAAERTDHGRPWLLGSGPAMRTGDLSGDVANLPGYRPGDFPADLGTEPAANVQGPDLDGFTVDPTWAPRWTIRPDGDGFTWAAEIGPGGAWIRGERRPTAGAAQIAAARAIVAAGLPFAWREVPC